MAAVGARAAASRRWSGRTWLLLALVAVLAAIVAGAGGPIGAAGAQRAQVIPSLSSPEAPAANQSCTTSCSHVSLHPGGVVQHGENVYFIFWQPSSPSGFYYPPTYASTLSGWLADAAAANYTAGNVFSVAQQYYDLTGPGGTRSFVPYALSAAPARLDTDPLPASSCSDSVPGSGKLPYCLTDAQVRVELEHVIAAGNLPQNDNTSYVLFTPTGVGNCISSSSCAYGNYCGYHSFFQGPAGTVIYSEMPWLYQMGGCDPQVSYGLGYANGSSADPTIGTVSRELVDMMTDPRLNAWYDATGHEVGAKCAFDFGPGGVGSSTGLHYNGLGSWNEAINFDEYLLPMEYSNLASNSTTTGCVTSDTDRQPSVKVGVSPASPVHGTSTHFTATVADPAGVSRIHWSFGDGNTAIGNPVTHVYQSAGTETVVAVVTDQHGNEKLVTMTVKVS